MAKLEKEFNAILADPNAAVAPQTESDSDAHPAAVFGNDDEEEKKDEETDEEKYERKMHNVKESARLASSEDEAGPGKLASKVGEKAGARVAVVADKKTPAS